MKKTENIFPVTFFISLPDKLGAIHDSPDNQEIVGVDTEPM